MIATTTALMIAGNVFFGANAIAGEFPELRNPGCLMEETIRICWAGNDTGHVSEGNEWSDRGMLGTYDRPTTSTSTSSVSTKTTSKPETAVSSKPDRKDRGHKGHGRGHGKGRGKGHGKHHR